MRKRTGSKQEERPNFPNKEAQFKPGESGNPNGRPPKLLSAINKELIEAGYERVTHTQVAEGYELLFNLPGDKIKEIALDVNNPMFLRITAKAMLGTKGMEMLEKMLDRGHGKALQKVDHTTKGDKLPSPFDISKYSDDELRTLVELQSKGRASEEKPT